MRRYALFRLPSEDEPWPNCSRDLADRMVFRKSRSACMKEFPDRFILSFFVMSQEQLRWFDGRPIDGGSCDRF